MQLNEASCRERCGFKTPWSTYFFYSEINFMYRRKSCENMDVFYSIINDYIINLKKLKDKSCEFILFITDKILNDRFFELFLSLSFAFI